MKTISEKEKKYLVDHLPVMHPWNSKNYWDQLSELSIENRRLKRNSISLIHDLKNHLQSLMLTIESSRSLQPEQMYPNVLKQTLAMKDTLTMISDFSEAYHHYHRTDPIQVIIDTAMLWQEKVRIGIFCNIEAPEVRLHIGAFRQIMINLIGNSVKHAGLNPVDMVFEVNRNDNFIEFIIKDNGKGLPDAVLNNFENLIPARFPGRESGSGLWLIRELITENGGEIKLEREKITLKLPASTGAPCKRKN